MSSLSRGLLMGLVLLPVAGARAGKNDNVDDPLPAHLYPHTAGWPRDCRQLPPPEIDDGYHRAYQAAGRGSHRRWMKPQVFTVVFHGDTQTFERRPNYTYPSSIVRVCISDPDYRLRYRIDQAPMDIAEPVPRPDFIANFFQKAAPAAEKKAPASTGEVVRAARELHDYSVTLQREALALPDASNAVALEVKVRDCYKAADAGISRLREIADEVAKSPASKLLDDDTAEQRTAFANIARALAIVTGDVRLSGRSVQELRNRLQKAQVVLELLSKDQAPFLRLAADVDAYKNSAKLIGDSVQYAQTIAVKQLQEKKKKATSADLDAVDKANAQVEVLNRYLAETQQEQAKAERLAQAVRRRLQNSAANSPLILNALGIAEGILRHFDLVDRNVFYLPVDKEKQYEIKIVTYRVKLVRGEKEGEKTEGGAQAKDRPLADGAAAGADSEPKNLPLETIGYEHEHEQEHTTTLQVRGLTYFRINLGLTYTTLQQGQFTLTQNDYGAQVITRRGEQNILPMILFSHYWCGVDLREVQPYDRFKKCGVYNTFIPTFTVGLPLSRNPIENVFVGALWQPVPGLAFTGGVHLGRTWVLQRGYVEGQPPPPPLEGQIFDVTTVQDQRLRLGYFFGIAITDSIFVTVISKVAGLNGN